MPETKTNSSWPRVYKSTVGAAAAMLEADGNAPILDAMVWQCAMPAVEIWVTTNVAATFTVYSNSEDDPTVWRDTLTPIVFLAGGTQRFGAPNASRRIKVETSTVGEHEVEIVGSPVRRA